jgi:choline dehydrogenase-like flavoprotein
MTTLPAKAAEAAALLVEADVAIVGGGPAGLAVALGLLGTGLRLVVLEAGGGSPGSPTAGSNGTGGPLGRVRVEGDDPYPQSSIDETRGTGLGGTATRWSFRMAGDRADPADPDAFREQVEAAGRGCRYAPLDPVDLARRDDVPYSGWPLTRAALDPWYSRAQGVAGLGAFAYSAESWAGEGCRPLDMAHGTVTSSMFQFGPATAWTRDAVARLRADSGVRIVTGAVVTRLDAEPGGDDARTVRGVRFVADGQVGEVRARAVVLAAGGIENSRLLLLSAGEGAPRGLGNAHDQVGRHFMEHPLVRGGHLVVDPVGGLSGRLRLYDAHWRAGSLVMAKLAMTDETVLRRGLVSTSVLLLPRDGSLVEPGVRAFQDLRSPSAAAAGSVRRARLALRAGLGAPSLLRARRAFATQPDVDDAGWTRRPGADGVRVLEMLHQTEQTPDPGNRVLLGDTLDAYGRRTAVLRWRWGAEDRRRVTAARDLYAEAFAKAGYARLVGGDWDAGQPRMIGGNHHHLGGTRMSRDPRDGVVDADCRVHGVRNLFVAGSSVFPTGGSVNPTLTIVALALRLAAHLRESALAGAAA